MLRKLILHRIYAPPGIEIRCLSSNNNSQLLSLLSSMWKMEKSGKSSKSGGIENGSSRYWELGNSNNHFVCIGGAGPMTITRKTKMYNMIDFTNKDFNKLHIEIFKCPKLLMAKVVTAFPRLSIRKEELRIIKLSYQNYADQSKGRHDCIVVANYLCEKLSNEGEFGFYSGAAIKNANNELYYHYHDYFNTHNNEIHVSVDSKNGYMYINNLTDDEVGIVYTDCDFDVPALRKWIQAVD